MTNLAYPLQWPMGWPRTPIPGVSKFGDRTVHAAVEQVKHELATMRATDLVISSNVTLGAQPKDKGVCAYFKLKHKPYALPCDKWNAVEDNLWAIAKHLESLRLQERWGVGSIERAFAGYLALPSPKDGRPWWEVLGVIPAQSLLEIKNQFVRLAQQNHPDNGGSHEEMARLNSAWTEAQEYKKKPL